MLLIYLNCPFLIAPSLFSNVCKVKNKPKQTNKKKRKKTKTKTKTNPNNIESKLAEYTIKDRWYYLFYT
jgi:hypothetical protein